MSEARWDHLNADYDAPTPEEAERQWADDFGATLGYFNTWHPDEREAAEHCLRTPNTRKAFINGYWEGFLTRKYHKGMITEDEFHFYDPFPGRWGRYYEEVSA